MEFRSDGAGDTAFTPMARRANCLADATRRVGKVADRESRLAPPHQASEQETRKPGFFRPPPLSNHFSTL